MPSRYPYKSRRSAEETIRRFFTDTSEDSISLDDAFRAWGRNVEKVEENKKWLSNKLMNLKYHNLIVPVYVSQNNRRVLKKLQLTLEGKRVLGRIGENVGSMSGVVSQISGDGKGDLKNVMDMVAKLKEQNPQFEIIFDVRLKIDKG